VEVGYRIICFFAVLFQWKSTQNYLFFCGFISVEVRYRMISFYADLFHCKSVTVLCIFAAVGVALKEASTPEFKTYQTQVVANSRALCSSLQKRGYTIVSGER